MSNETHIRKVRPDEIEEVWRVHVTSSSDLGRRELYLPSGPVLY